MSDGQIAKMMVENAQMSGMIWWLAAALAADDGDPQGTPESWVSKAEAKWVDGFRYQTRFVSPNGSVWVKEASGE